MMRLQPQRDGVEPQPHHQRQHTADRIVGESWTRNKPSLHLLSRALEHGFDFVEKYVCRAQASVQVSHRSAHVEVAHCLMIFRNTSTLRSNHSHGGFEASFCHCEIAVRVFGRSAHDLRSLLAPAPPIWRRCARSMAATTPPRLVHSITATIILSAFSTASMAQNRMQLPEGPARLACMSSKNPELGRKLERCKQQAYDIGLRPGSGRSNGPVFKG